ncbi:MAG TPA: ATP-binding domain-containing protein [Polyangia bacterium]|nr:ATP-binding domain-containing protein [Polyangia bacterium]
MTSDLEPAPAPATGGLPDAGAEIPAEEERLLARVLASLAAHAALSRRPPVGSPGSAGVPAATSAYRRGYVDELVALRDEIGEARLEDVPQLVAQMERLQGVALTRADLQTILVDSAAPYFGHLRLREEVRGRGAVERDVLIGRATFVDAPNRINVVDWRHAPVSQLFYRYGEGSDYEERFGERDVEGEIVLRRVLTIEGGLLRRVACPQGVWARRIDGGWERTDLPTYELAGGEQTATRATRAIARPAVRGVLGAAPTGRRALDRHLPEIAALIDPRQFDLITARDAGVVVIQGGAGSGKTTVGLHRLAYLAYTFPDKFPPRRLAVVTHGIALAAYIGQVLPSLGIDGVRVVTFGELAERELRVEIPWLRAAIVDDTVPVVTRVKSHPALLHELERLVAGYRGKRTSRSVVELWADLLTDRSRLLALLRDAAEMPVLERDVLEAHAIMVDRVAAIVARDPRELDGAREKVDGKAKKKRGSRDGQRGTAPPPDMHWTAMGLEQKGGQRTVDSDLPEGIRRVEGGGGADPDDDADDDQNIRGATGIDGLRTEDDLPLLDLDDVAILLRANQLLRGVKKPFAHLFVDEAQDLSPMKLSVLIGRTPKPSITLAGDTSQRLFLDNGFGDWRAVLGHLSLAHVAIEPLRIAYRSTREILALARSAMGPLADAVPPEAPRSGAPVEAFRFPAAGAAVAFLAEALRDLSAREPRATVALLARHPEQADRYFEGLRRAEVPALRRIRAQEFAFRPGVEVTDVRQVKGLEFDYVVMLDVNASSYGRDDESRHLFHIGVTRAAHQLWLVVTGEPSAILPEGLVRR